MTYVAAFWFVSPTCQLFQTSKQCGGKKGARYKSLGLNGLRGNSLRNKTIQKKHHRKRDQGKISSQGGKTKHLQDLTTTPLWLCMAGPGYICKIDYDKR